MPLGWALLSSSEMEGVPAFQSQAAQSKAWAGQGWAERLPLESFFVVPLAADAFSVPGTGPPW